MGIVLCNTGITGVVEYGVKLNNNFLIYMTEIK